IDRAFDQAVPAAEPVAGTADDGYDALRIVAVEAGCVLDQRGDTSLVGEEVAEVMRNLGVEYIPARFKRCFGEVDAVPAAEAARRCDAFAWHADVFQDSQGVGHVVGKLVGGFVLAPAGVLDVVASLFGIGPAGFGVDDPRVANHLRVYVPVGHDKLADEFEAVVKLLLRPAGKTAVEPADTGRVGDYAVLALDAVLVTPLAELADERIWNLAGQAFPVLLVAVRPCRREVRYAEVGHVHKAGRVVDNQADRHPVLRIQYSDIACLARAKAFVPGDCRDAVESRRRTGCCDCRL
ncbi:MAG: hypothetical protein ACYSTT_16170, partial [Planctomycetota bacterium]